MGMTLEFKFEQKDVEDFLKNYIRPERSNNPDYTLFKPVRFGYTTDYAEALEYGTGPLRLMQPTVHGGSYTYDSIWKEIDDWARRKLNMQNKAYRENFVTGVVNRMWDKGLYPHIYFRPALDWLENNIQIKVDEGWSFFEIADEAMRISNRMIMDKGLPFTGKLQTSAVLDSLDYDEVYDATQRTSVQERYDKERRFNDALDKVQWI